MIDFVHLAGIIIANVSYLYLRRTKVKSFLAIVWASAICQYREASTFDPSLRQAPRTATEEDKA